MLGNKHLQTIQLTKSQLVKQNAKNQDNSEILETLFLVSKSSWRGGGTHNLSISIILATPLSKTLG